MKDAITTWNRILGRSYSVVSTNPNERSTYADDCPTNSPRFVGLDLLSGKFRGIITISFLGLLTFGIGLFILLVQPYDVLFKLKCIFTEGGEIFEIWRNPPVDLYLRVYLFNVTNREAFMNGTEKLRMEEVGPYVYKESLSHANITFNENGTVSSMPYHPLTWVPELSEGHKEDDLLILPNIALLAITHVISSSSFLTQFGLNLVIRQTDTQPLIQMTAKEFMFGYKSELMSLGYKFMPNWIDFDSLGLIDRMYNFDGDFETVYTGEKDVRQTGLIETYRGSKYLPHWEGECGNVHNASDGTKFASYIQPNDSMLFYRKSLCRAQPLVRVNTTTHSGFEGYVYNFEKNSNDNGHHNPENKCFCKEGNCLPAGLVDVRDCYYGFPIAVSYPHFYEADPSVLEHVDGMHPEEDKHKSFFIVEPKSGMPLEVAARFQINMVLGDVQSMAHVEKFSNMVIPTLWMELRMNKLPESLIDRFFLYLIVLPKVETAAMWFTFFLAAVFISIAAYKYSKKVRSLNKVYKAAWIDEYVEEDINRKLSAYSYVPEKRASLSSKELESYFNSLVTPTEQDLGELERLKEEEEDY